MKRRLKKLDDQVLVITGASSGIGLATARLAARRGARLVLASRSREALRDLTHEIAEEGGDAIQVVADVRIRAVAVTLVKPGAIDTPFPLNAKNYLDAEPQHLPPVYSPDSVARAILHCAETPTRDVYVGAGGKYQAAMGHDAPRFADRLMERAAIRGTHGRRPPRPRHLNALDRPSEHLEERGVYGGHVARSSLYAQASLHPMLTVAARMGAGLLLASARR